MRLCCRRIHTHTRAYTPDDKCLIIPPRQWTPTNNKQQPQCRICLDGPDPDLGHLTRPVSAVALSAYGKPSPLFLHAPIPLTKLLSLKRIRIVCAPRMPAAVDEYICQCLCIFCLPVMPLCHYRHRFAHTKIVGLATNPGASSVHPHHSTPLHSHFVPLVHIRNLSHAVPVPVAITTLSTALVLLIVDPRKLGKVHHRVRIVLLCVCISVRKERVDPVYSC